MKTKLFHLGIIMLTLALFSCNKEKENSPKKGTIELSFQSLTNSTLKDAEIASALVISIEDLSGKVLYSNQRVDLYNIGGSYISKPLSVVPGSYKITKFLVVNAANTAIYAAPLENSAKAYLVEDPLPINFEVSGNATTKIIPQVISLDNSSAQEFGYSTFSFDIVNTFDFQISIFVYNEQTKSFELTSAQLTISDSDSTTFQQELIAKTNTITVKANQCYYKLTIDKSGYLSYSHTFTADSLKKYMVKDGNIPLVINLLEEIVTDIDGNIYHTVRIGNQVWMKENLKVTKYNDGTNIPKIITHTHPGESLETPGYNWYNEDEATYKNPYGALYDGFAAISPKLCPPGWHVPSLNEWLEVLDVLGGEQIAVNKLKEAGNAHWTIPNSESTNSSGFTALPGGYRGDNVQDNPYPFFNIGKAGYWWTTTLYPGPFKIWVFGMGSHSILRMNEAYSVRCLKNY